MTLKVYNTLTRRKEEFEPITPGKAGIYTCGVTVYDTCHMGHARSAVAFDVITKYLRFRGYDVTYVKNFTDVDDKIISRANKESKDISEVTERYILEHDRDMDELGVSRPDIAPRATENIPGMIALIGKLFEKGLAYEAGGNVFFAVDKFAGYGKLSGRKPEDMLAGARIEVDEKKRSPLDFALWKASKEGEPKWESPWGPGRPGWHIECSVMSQRYLGETFDIHGGGEDLIFPHHENEIAQSEGATGKPFARYWLHNGFIRIESEKMSKSLGNVFSIREMLGRYHPEVLRLFILQSHYRSPVDFTEEALAEARSGMERFYSTLNRIKEVLASAPEAPGLTPEKLGKKDREAAEKINELPARFVEAMDDDFNTARAIGFIFDAVRTVNGYLNEKGGRIDAPASVVLAAARDRILETGKVLGLFQEDPEVYFRKDRDREISKLKLDVREVERLIEERRSARAAKDWKRADEIRAELASRRIVIKDGAQGTTWTIE
ncbi:MAG: cysteine--tRNA ligase [Syntrophales bacterium]|nr:cysteine--tRNA ligase [Syntrophales bacterium]MDD5534068.1 cysteine--tRNA ligase [Syntrophales bacterium]HPL63992.1 cysteine--tRNA ligase [Syntrophales bacterium]